MFSNVKILDCTLRDGGLGLEDAYKNGISDTRFELDDYYKLIEHLRDSKADIVELGSIEITEDDRTGFGIYRDVESISKLIPDNANDGQLFVGLFRGPDTPVEDIPEWREGLVKGLRVIIRYSELQKSLDFCAALASKGYNVFVQPMLTMRYTDEELIQIIEASNKMKAYALYFVDSYGYMEQEDVTRLYEFYNKRLDPSIRIGFHSHNNMNMAYANVKHFMEIADGREIIADSCITGMGQGAGNLQTEIISFVLNENGRYDYSEVLNACEIIEKYTDMNAWGYSVTRLLPALYKSAYKYSIVMRNKYNLSYAKINELMQKMTQEMRLRYTPEYLEQLFEMCGVEIGK